MAQISFCHPSDVTGLGKQNMLQPQFMVSHFTTILADILQGPPRSLNSCSACITTFLLYSIADCLRGKIKEFNFCSLSKMLSEA